MLNLWIGLCDGAHGLPSALRSLGFRHHTIEQRIWIDDQNECVPEFIACSKSLGHSLLFEWKSGPNVVADQLRRYGLVSSERLIHVNLMPREATKSFDVVIVAQGEHAERIKKGVVDAKCLFPVLAITATGVELIHN